MASDQCMNCARWRGDKTCAAFPDDIPDEIWSGGFDHRLPLEGDGGKKFVQATFTRKDTALAYPEGAPE